MTSRVVWSKRIGILRRLPATVPGKARLARALLQSVRSRGDVIVESSVGTKFVVPRLAEPVGFRLLVDGRYEPETEDFILGHLSTGDTFIDAGASIGVFSMSAARKVGECGKILAVEPSPRVFPYLERNVALNGLKNVMTVQVALSHENHGSVPFYLAPQDHFGMGALAPQFHEEPCFVITRKLDDLVAENNLDRVRVLKVDVEGSELLAFQGANNLLTASFGGPKIVFEFCDWAEQRFPGARAGQAQEFLLGLGYRIWRLGDYLNGGTPLSAPLTVGSAMLVAER